MTTLLVSENFPPKVGGSSRWFWEIYRRLPREEFLIAAGEDPRQEQFDRTHNLRVIRVPLTLPDWGVFNSRTLRWYWKIVQTLGRIVKSEGIEQIHCGRCLPEGWMAWMLKQRHGIPYVCYAHGEEVNTVPVGQLTGILSSRQLRWMMRKVVRGADFVIANSQNTRRILIDGWNLPVEKIRLLYPGVDTKRFVPAPRNEAVRAQLGWKDRRVVLTVGRLDIRKGHDQMILALQAIRKVIPDVLYSIVGNGDQEESLRVLVEKEGLSAHVQFLGELDDERLRCCYQQCDLFVLPNRQVGNDIEGFGMVLLEAQACGKPVLAGDSGGTAETMKIPETGRVISCDTSREMEAAVIELLSDSDLRARMGQVAHQWVVERFDWTVLSQQAQVIFKPPSADGRFLQSGSWTQVPPQN